LNPNTMIVDQHHLDYDKLESRSTGPNSGAGSGLYYGGNLLKVGSTTSNFASKKQELFVSSMGETGANELKFFNLNADSREH